VATKGQNIMACSEKQAAANLLNAQKSTGPTSVVGKAKSRFNGLVHGMRAATVVLPTEDPEAFELEVETWCHDWNVNTAARRILAEMGARDAWRIRRSFRVEANHLTELANAKVKDYKNQRQQDIKKAQDLLMTNPKQSLAILHGFRMGLEWLLDAWTELADWSSKPETWNSIDWHHSNFAGLLGYEQERPEDELPDVCKASLRLIAINTDPNVRRTRDEAKHLANLIHVEARESIEITKTKLNSYLSQDSINHKIMESAYIDDSPRGRCLKRYEAQADRTLHKTIDKLMSMAKSNIDIKTLECSDQFDAELGAGRNVVDFQQPAFESEPIAPEKAPTEPILVLSRGTGILPVIDDQTHGQDGHATLISEGNAPTEPILGFPRGTGILHLVDDQTHGQDGHATLISEGNAPTEPILPDDSTKEVAILKFDRPASAKNGTPKTTQKENAPTEPISVASSVPGYGLSEEAYQRMSRTMINPFPRPTPSMIAELERELDDDLSDDI
jgi:hypothetical protein